MIHHIGHLSGVCTPSCWSDADRDARFVTAVRKAVHECVYDRNAVARIREAHVALYGRPCEPEPGVKPNSQTYEEWQRERVVVEHQNGRTTKAAGVKPKVRRYYVGEFFSLSAARIVYKLCTSSGVLKSATADIAEDCASRWASVTAGSAEEARELYQRGDVGAWISTKEAS